MRFILRRFTLALVLSVLGSPGSVQADAGDDPFAAAAVPYDQRQWQEACDAFDKLLAEYPDHPRGNEARFFYGEALAQLSRWPEARAQFDELRKRDPDHRYARQALFRGGEAAYLGGDDRAAQHDLDAFRAQFPKDKLYAYVLPYLASLELQAGNTEAAQRLFADGLEQFPDGPLVDECRLGLAQTHEKSHALEQARQEYQTIVESNSRLADQALLHLGAVENALGEHASALAALARLEAKFPDSPLQPMGRLERSYSLYKLGRYREAEVLLRDLVKKPATSVEAYYWLGLSLKARKQWSEAASAFAAGGKIDEHHRLAAALGFQTGDALLRQGQYAPAREQFERVLKTWPQSPWADDCLLGQLQIAYEQTAYEDCTRLADEFAKRFPDSPLRSQAELVQGRSLLARKKYAEAVDPLEKALKRKIPPQSAPSVDQQANLQAALAVCYSQLGRWAEAKQMLSALGEQKVSAVLTAETTYQVAEVAYAADDVPLARDLFSILAKDEQAPDLARRVLPGLGWCHFKSGNWSEAASAFGRLVNQYPDSPLAGEAALMRGRALEQMNQLDPALAMYYVVIEQYPHCDQVAEALWHAARLHDQLQQRTQAIDLYARLVKNHPDFAELDAAIYCWAWLLRQSGQVSAADDLFAQLRRDFPQSHFAVDATLRLAERAIAAKNYDDAEKLLSEAAQSKTPAVRQHAWYLQGRMAMARQQWSAVEAPLVQLIENFPECELALPAAYLIAEASYRQGEFEKAAQQLAELAKKSAGRTEPFSATAELRRAQALAQMKEWSQTLEIARSIPQRFPNFEQQYEVDYLIGRTLAAQADFEGAREAYVKVIESPRGSHTETAAMARWMIGESYFHQENYTDALTEYSKVDEQYPFPRWQAAALLQAGKCHELLGEWRLAVEVYGRLLKTYPQSELCAEATRRSGAAGQHASSGSSQLK